MLSNFFKTENSTLKKIFDYSSFLADIGLRSICWLQNNWKFALISYAVLASGYPLAAAKNHTKRPNNVSNLPSGPLCFETSTSFFDVHYISQVFPIQDNLPASSSFPPFYSKLRREDFCQDSSEEKDIHFYITDTELKASIIFSNDLNISSKQKKDIKNKIINALRARAMCSWKETKKLKYLLASGIKFEIYSIKKPIKYVRAEYVPAKHIIRLHHDYIDTYDIANFLKHELEHAFNSLMNLPLNSDLRSNPTLTLSANFPLLFDYKTMRIVDSEDEQNLRHALNKMNDRFVLFAKLYKKSKKGLCLTKWQNLFLRQAKEIVKNYRSQIHEYNFDTSGNINFFKQKMAKSNLLFNIAQTKDSPAYTLVELNEDDTTAYVYITDPFEAFIFDSLRINSDSLLSTTKYCSIRLHNAMNTAKKYFEKFWPDLNINEYFSNSDNPHDLLENVKAYEQTKQKLYSITNALNYLFNTMSELNPDDQKLKKEWMTFIFSYFIPYSTLELATNCNDNVKTKAVNTLREKLRTDIKLQNTVINECVNFFQTILTSSDMFYKIYQDFNKGVLAEESAYAVKMPNAILDFFAPEFLAVRGDISSKQIERYEHTLGH